MKRDYINQERLAVGKFIQELSPIDVIHKLEEEFSDDMNPMIPDMFLRVMVWQIIESFGGLEEAANMTFSSIDEIQKFVDSTDNRVHQIMGRNVIAAFDSLEAYVTA